MKRKGVSHKVVWLYSNWEKVICLKLVDSEEVPQRKIGERKIKFGGKHLYVVQIVNIETTVEKITVNDPKGSRTVKGY